MAFELKSPAFKEGETIPEKYTCDGEDVSPPLRWTGAPEGTQSYALICEDPDAPVGTFDHWVLYDIPPEVTELKENLPKTKELKNGMRQGKNDFRRIGYGGPCPPSGPPHQYIFRLYALEEKPIITPGVEKRKLIGEIDDFLLDTAELKGKYKRK